MITITKNGNAVKFLFEDSQHYLMGDGEIEVPVNSLSLIIDESEMVTFKKASSDDIFVSFNPADSNLSTKAGVVDFYKNNMVGSTGGGSGSGVTSGEVQTMIDASLVDYPTIDDVDETLEDYYTKDEVDAGFTTVNDNIASAVSGKAETSAVTALNSSLTAHTADTGIHTTTAEKEVWNAKQNALTAGTGIEINNNVISVTASTGGSNVVELTQAQYDALATKDPDVLYVITDAPEINVSGYAQSSAVTAEIAAAVSGKADTTAVTQDIAAAVSGKVDTTAITTSVTSASTDSQIPTAKAVYDAIPTGSTGGGATYSAGTNISIDTANTINCTLPITATTNDPYGSISFGNAVTVGTGMANVLIGIDATISNNSKQNIVLSTNDFDAYGSSANNNTRGIAIGCSNTLSGGNVNVGGGIAIGDRAKSYSGGIAIGSNLRASGSSTVAIGLSANASGTTKMNLNNQIKVDTNNQVYIKDKDNVNEVCIQDTIAALGGLKFVKLTQSEYDQLATKDNMTVYIIA